MSKIDENIAVACNGANTQSSAQLAQLISEVEAAIAEVEQAAQDTRRRALNPTITDPSMLRKQASDFEFRRERLNAALPVLRQRHQAAADQECYNAWAAQFDPLVPRHAAVVVRLKEICQEFEQQLVETLVEAQDVDNEVRRVAFNKPHHLQQTHNDGRNLRDVEYVARGLDGIGINMHSIMRDLKLPSFADPHRLAWPPPPPVVYYMAGITLRPPIHGADYSAARVGESKRMLEFYADQQKAKEQREAASAAAERRQQEEQRAAREQQIERELQRGSR
jgi:hypothetical protein